MQDLQQQLELVFGASIMSMTIEDRNNVASAQFQLGTIYTQIGKPSRVIRLKLVHRNLLSGFEPRKIDSMHAFDGITIHAALTSAIYEQNVNNPFPIHTVELVVWDLEAFQKDVSNYCYKHFSDYFFNALDKVLEEE